MASKLIVSCGFVPRIPIPSDLIGTTVSVKNIFEALEQRKATFKLMIVDACRDDPFATRSVAGASALRTLAVRRSVVSTALVSVFPLFRNDKSGRQPPGGRENGLIFFERLDLYARKNDSTVP